LNRDKYNEEKKKLFDWSTEELRLIDEKYPYKGGFDGEDVVRRKEHLKEYNKKLLELKKKYNID